MAGPSAVFAYLLPDPEHSAARGILVLAYLGAAAIWFWAFRRTRQAPPDSCSRWWLIGAVLLFLLALNKEFDLRRQFELGFRWLAQSGGWYERRRPLQFFFAVILPSGVGAIALVMLATKARVFAAQHFLAAVGWGLLFVYLALRQCQEWKPMLPWLEALRYHDWRLALEVGGLLLVGLAGLRRRPSPACGSAQ